MSPPVSVATANGVQNAEQVPHDGSAFHPSVWGDHFLSYASVSIETEHIKKLLELKEEVKRMLMDEVSKPVQKLELIDTIQRLGISYHFESEIDEIFETIYHDNDISDDNNDLYLISLQFRLLRQHGYKISSAAFEKFKDDEGGFKTSLINDVHGMLSLYEAAHLGIHGEDILDEAIAFTTTNLKPMLSRVSPNLAERINHALNRPLRKGIPRFETMYFMSIYPKDDLHNETLLKMAKLDFSILQASHQKELSALTKWWKDLDFSTKLPYARDRLVELYVWVLGVYFEPQYAYARKIMTKVICMTSIIDDTFDASYATLEELKAFTEAVNRWDISVIDILPEYLKLIYKTLLDVYNEIEEDMVKEGRSYCVSYAKEVMKHVVQNYFAEAKWHNEGYIPTMEEYMPVALVTSGYLMLPIISFLGMGDIANKEAFDWASNIPKIVRASAIIGRLMDDIASHKFEQERGHVASGVECHMKQHGVSEEETVKLFRKEVANAWKDINEAFLKPTAVPVPILERALNLSRVVDVLYKDEDCYTFSYRIKDEIASLLRDPVKL